VQVAVLWSIQNGYLDDVPVARVKEFQSKLIEFLTLRKAQLLENIEREKTISDALQGAEGCG